MKKTGKDEKKTEDGQAKYFIYVIIFIVLFIAAVLSIRYFWPQKSRAESYSYNNFIFTNMSGLWFTDVYSTRTGALYTVPLHFSPRELGNITIDGDVNAFKNKTLVYITFDPTGNEFSYIALSASELSINLAQTLNITPVASCTVNVSGVCTNRPVIDCKKPGESAVYLKYDNVTKIYMENNCIVVQGKEWELVKASDRLLLKWFNVMQ